MSDATEMTGRPRDGLLGYLKQHPPGFWFIFWGELAERSSFYGMRAILLLYVSTQLGLGDRIAGFTMSQFIAASYFLPLVGGYIADNYFGKYWTIVGFSIPYILGHVILGVESVPFMILALILLAMGSGVIKPNISTLMGLTYEQKRPGQPQLLSDAFAIYYGAINLGSAASTFAMPWLRNHYGYAIAFLFPAILMAVAFALFASGKKYYATEVIDRKASTPEERVQKRAVIGRIFGLFFVICFFWSVFDQQASTWTFFARDLLALDLFGVDLAPDSIQAFNPVFVLSLLPIVTISWRLFAKFGMPLRATDKMTVGFLCTALSMAIMAVPAYLAHRTVERHAADGYHFVMFDDEGTDEVGKIAGSGAGGVSQITTAGEVATIEIDDPSKVVYVSQLPLSPEGIYANYLAGGYSFIALSPAVFETLSVQRERLEKATERAIEGTIAAVESTDELDALAIPDGTKVAIAGAEENAASADLLSDVLARYPGAVAPKIGGPELLEALEARYPEAIALPKPTVLWQIFAYVIVTIAELCISVVGLELAFTAAPKSMKGFITGCFLLTVFCGNQINSVLVLFYPKIPAWIFFALMSLMMVPVTFAFLFIARRFNQAVARQLTSEVERSSIDAADIAVEGRTPPGD